MRNEDALNRDATKDLYDVADLAWLKLSCLITSKMCGSVQGAVQRVQISEIYPSIVRALSMGFFVTLGNFASAFAPFFDDLVSTIIIRRGTALMTTPARSVSR